MTAVRHPITDRTAEMEGYLKVALTHLKIQAEDLILSEARCEQSRWRNAVTIRAFIEDAKRFLEERS
jgi:hypothetical protein